MAVLYRKYRPQTFAEVIGQKYIIQTLKNQVASGQVAHAYLFTGSRGVGKTSVARILAKAVNCLHPKSGEPDGSCEVCQAIAQNNFLDLVEIDAASNTGVDNIRDLIEHVKFAPSRGKYKVFIIDEVHMLSKGAFNALLKTLEEPPAHAIFILATTEINKVPATIISRSQRFDFKTLSVADIQQQLAWVAKSEKVEMNEKILELVAENAQGSSRDALSLLGKVLTLGADATLEDCQQLLGSTDIAWSERLLDLIAQGAAAQIPNFFDELLEKGTDLNIFNKDFLEYLRKVLIYKAAGAGEFGLAEAHTERLNQLAKGLSLHDILFTIRLFLKSFKDMASSPDPQIPLLLAAVEAALKKETIPGAATAQPAHPARTASYQPPATPNLEQAVIVQPQEPVVLSVEYDQQVTLEQVQVIWPKAIAEIKKINTPLGNTLRTAPLRQVRNGKVVVEVKYIFHKQNLENQKNLKLICEILEQLLGKRIGLAAEVTKTEIPTVDGSTALTDALKIFGGELVE